MKLLNLKNLSLLCALCFFASPCIAQDEGAMNRSDAFVSINAIAPQILADMKSKKIDDETNKEVMPPQEFSNTLVEMTDSLYRLGFITLVQFNSKKAQVAACANAEILFRGDPTLPNMEARNVACNVAVNYSQLSSAVPPCINANQLLSGGSCCPGLKEGVSQSLEITLQGKKSNESCVEHSECASKVCDRDIEESSGICASTLSCFKPARLGEECSSENPYCLQGMCMPQSSGIEGVQCKPKDAVCSNNGECCSSNCANGKCTQRYICEDCVAEGTKAGQNQLCCKGLIEDLDKYCIPDLPPFILPRADGAGAAPATTTGGSSGGGSGGGTDCSDIAGGDQSAECQEQPQRQMNNYKNDAKGIFEKIMSFVIPSAYAEVESPANNNKKEIQGTWQNDDALTKEQLDMIENRIKLALKIGDKDKRKAELLSIYKERKQMTSDNAASIKAGKDIGFVMNQEEYVKRYNIPSITPKGRSDILSCTFNTAKDNWIDSPNLTRNAELFLRAFEVSYSGKGTQDRWHLPNQTFTLNKDNLYTRTKSIMTELRDNRNHQLDQTRYIDLIMACQCIYTFGLEKFDADKQAFFFSQCTGTAENKICRSDAKVLGTSSNPDADGQSMQDTLMLPTSPTEAYRKGLEFPNYVQMYMDNLMKMDTQGTTGSDDIDGVDGGAAGISHEEVLVRWLRIRSCNQIDTFLDAEKVETKLQDIVKDVSLASRDNDHMKQYWANRIKQMKDSKISKAVYEHYEKDTTKTKWYRGYYHSESKFKEYTKKSLKFLFFLILALLVLATAGVFAIFVAVNWAIIGIVAGSILLVGGINSAIVANVSLFKTSAMVLENLSKDFPPVLIEDRLVKKETCKLIFNCKTFYRILHWPVFSTKVGIENRFPFKFKETRKCADTLATAMTFSNSSPNPCSGPFKGTMCAQSFYRPMPDTKIIKQPEYREWMEMMAPKMLMDPVWPDLYEGQQNVDARWMSELHKGFGEGCKWIEAQGKKYKAKAEDKFKFFPDLSNFINKSNGEFHGNFVFDQQKIDDYKKAVKKYALCSKDSANGRYPNLYDCGAKYYDGNHPNPKGFGDIFEDEATAELFADYVYQMHFNWRHMSGEAGIGYPLAYLQSYYMNLLHNIRLLTTLTVKKGLELDDAYNLYAEDLRIRRSNYQIESNNYGMGMGSDKKDKVVQSQVFRSFRAMGFPLTSEFEGLPEGGALPGTAVSGTSANSQNLGGFQRQVLNAAKRHSERVSADNRAFKNFQEQAKKSPTANARLGAASSFFTRANSPVSGVRALANPNDNTTYSGIGGNTSRLGAAGAGGLGKNGEGETQQKFGLVASTKPQSNFGGDSGSRNFNNSNQSGAIDYNAAFGQFSNTGSDASKELSDASKITGMKESDLKDMLDSANKNRNKDLQATSDDSLFKQISKAYHRNLDRVLVRKRPLTPVDSGKTKEVESNEREEIKNLFK